MTPKASGLRHLKEEGITQILFMIIAVLKLKGFKNDTWIVGMAESGYAQKEKIEKLISKKNKIYSCGFFKI